MKKRLLVCILTAALASCAALSLSACGEDKKSSGADNSAQTTASSSGAASDSGKSDKSSATAASGNEKDSKETQPVKSASNNTSNENRESSAKTKTDTASDGSGSGEQKSGEEYVATEMECTVPYKGFLYITGEDNKANGSARCRLPRLTIDSADAKKINDEIIEQYGAAFEYYNEMIDTNQMGRTDYVYYVNKNVLSLIIESRSVNTPNSYISAYNIDLNTGNRINNSDIIALTGVSAEDVEAELCGELFDLFEPIMETGAPATEAYKRTIDAENLSKTDYFFDGNGALNASYRYYWIAGAENYGKASRLTPVIK